jgi:hypothetical protein
MKCSLYQAEFTGILNGWSGVANAQKDVSVPSLHYFTGIFITCYLPMVSIMVAQLKVELLVKSENDGDFDVPEKIATCFFGLFDVFLANLAFHGMFALIGIFQDPYGKDAGDFPIFALAEGAHKKAEAILAYSSGD